VWILCERDYVHVVHFEVGEKQPTVAAFCHLHNSAVSNGYVYAAANVRSTNETTEREREPHWQQLTYPETFIHSFITTA